MPGQHLFAREVRWEMGLECWRDRRRNCAVLQGSPIQTVHEVKRLVPMDVQRRVHCGTYRANDVCYLVAPNTGMEPTRKDAPRLMPRPFGVTRNQTT